MLLALNLAFKNLMGGRLRTVLNILILSFAFVIIIFFRGIMNGMDEQMSRAMIDEEIAGGQYWVESYDPFDPLTLDEAYMNIPAEIQKLINNGTAEQILLRPATIFPQGRDQNVILRGINPNQKLVTMPTIALSSQLEFPLLIGKHMAKSSGLNVGDKIMIRWRDKHGAFDAKEGTIVSIMDTIVQTIDRGQIWMRISDLQELSGLPNEATIILVDKNVTPELITGWTFRSTDFLLSDVKSLVKTKQAGAVIMYALLLFLAMLAIFDTQVLAVFRRRKEIGTMIAMGMTRNRVIAIFTIEGALNGVFAIIAGAIWGYPLLRYFAVKGMSIYSAADDFGMAIPDRLYAYYSGQLIIGTTLLIFILVTIVSYLPTRKIAKLNPTEAIRGKTT